MKPCPDSQSPVLRKRTAASLILLLAALIWGTGFIPQKIAAERMSPYAFNGWRYLAASLFIFALARFRFPRRKTEIFGILVNGVLLFGGATLQQAGIALTTVGNTGFITTLYVVLVPFLSALFLKTKLTANALLAAALAAIGLYLLTTAGLGLARITPGDVIVFLGAVLWAVQILTIKLVIHEIDPLVFSASQFFVCAVMNLTVWGVADRGDLRPVLESLPIVLYAGLIVAGGGYTLQAIGMRNANPAHAANILGLESVFAMLFGMILLSERPLPIQFVGGALIFIAAWLTSRTEIDDPGRPHDTERNSL